MSIATLILGESGTGKSYSMRNMSPDDTLLIQCVKKSLPFKPGKWKLLDSTGGNIYISDNWQHIISAMQKTKRKVIVIDDFQYMMANEFLKRSSEKGYDKFTDMAVHVHEVLTCANNLPDDVRVYLLSHTNSGDDGVKRMKTIGKMLDEKIVPEGLFTIVLRTFVEGGQFYFSTVNNGQDTVKSPVGLFQSQRIDNDLDFVDKSICEYYGLKEASK